MMVKYIAANLAKATEFIPELQTQYINWIHACDKNGLDFRVTEVYRSPERQQQLFKIGRRGIKNEAPVTWVLKSNHQSRIACDIYPIVGTLEQIESIGQQFGFSRPSSTKKMGDYMHFEGKIVAIQSVSPEARLKGLVRRAALTKLISVKELLTAVISRLEKRVQQ